MRANELKDNPLVPIRGDRVKEALRRKGLSNRRAAELLCERGAQITATALNDITNGERRSCRKCVRRELARLCGRPITARFLGGKVDIRPHGSDMIGLRDLRTGRFIIPPWRGVGSDGPLPPEHELEAYTLAEAFRRAWRRDFPGEPLPVDVHGASRALMSLPLWRSILNRLGDQGSFGQTEHGSDPVVALKQEAGAFAAHLGAAVQVLLRPWLNGQVAIRRQFLEVALCGFATIYPQARERASDAIGSEVEELLPDDVFELPEDYREVGARHQ